MKDREKGGIEIKKEAIEKREQQGQQKGVIEIRSDREKGERENGKQQRKGINSNREKLVVEKREQL